MRKKLTEDEKKQILAMRDKNYSLRYLAGYFKVTETAISALIRRSKNAKNPQT